LNLGRAQNIIEERYKRSSVKSRRAAILCSTALMGMFWGMPSFAQDAPAPVAVGERSFDIPAQPLAQALDQFQAQSALQIAYGAKAVDGRTSSEVKGVMSPEAALRALLVGTGGVTYQFTGPTTVAILSPVDSVGAIALDPVQVEGADLETTYRPQPSSVASRMTLPPEKTPFSINQVSFELMRERGDFTIYETLERFAGVGAISSNGDIGQGMSRSVTVRGFSASGSNQLLINGQRTYASSGSARGVYSIERAEVLRGPAALYYGSSEPGGVVNYTFKRPLSEARHTALVKADDHGSYGGMVDLTGPVTKDRKLLYRFVGGYDHTENDQDHIWSEPMSLLSALTFAPTDTFETTLSFEWLDVRSVPEQENNFFISEGPYAGDHYPVPREFFWGSLNDRAERDTKTWLWDAAWEVTPTIKVNLNASRQTYTQWWQNTRVDGASTGPDEDGYVNRYVSGRQSEGENWSIGGDISGQLSTGFLEHDWLIGAGFGHSESRSSGRQVANQSRASRGGNEYPVDPINIFNPVYTDYAYQYRIWEDPLGDPSSREDTNLFFQDLIYLPGGGTRLMVAAGWSQYKNIPGSGDEVVTSRWSPRVALMHDITPELMIYASYGESFSPNSLNRLDENGDYITAPIEGVQYEFGLKQELFNDKAVATLALFRIDKRNQLMPLQDPSLLECDSEAAPAPGTPATYDGTGDCRYALNGLERSQGVEFQLSGDITPWWSATIGYSYNETEYEETDDLDALGRSFLYTPKHSFSFWSKFRVLKTDNMSELHLGTGVNAWSRVHNSWNQPDETGARTDWNPGYALVDLGLFWEGLKVQGHDLKVSLNVRNVFNSDYYDRRRFKNAGTFVWGDERRVLLSVQGTF
jgi:TonB-dependent siderophore receptor